MSRVDQARSRLQAANEQLSGARGLSSNFWGEWEKAEESVVGPVEEFLEDVDKGFNEALGDALSGLWDTVTNPIETGKDVWAGLQEAAADPNQAIKEAWEDFKEPYVEDWNNGHPGQAIGRGLFEVIPGVGIAKKALDVLTELGKRGDAPEAPNDPGGGEPAGPSSNPNDPGGSGGEPEEPSSAEPARAEDYVSDQVLSEERLQHILDGDAQGGGGHGPGRGIPGKSEFPSNWSDEQTMRNVLDVATDPNPTEYRRQDGGPIDRYYDRNGDPVRFAVEGIRDGVKIRVITEPAGEGIITAFPPDIAPNP